MLQEAATHLHLNSDDTTYLAKKLYEQGYITYVRTDSTTLSEEAMSAAREQITELFGPEAVADHKSASARATSSRQPRLSQGAHEAIRPTGTTFCRPEDLPPRLQDARELYDLIWRRTLASQMAASHQESLTVLIRVKIGAAYSANGMPSSVDFDATGTDVTKLGWRAIWPPHKRTIREDHGTPGVKTVRRGTKLLVKGATPQSHRTQQPKRYTEASLINELERSGIGRPSTYASIVPTLLAREYVRREGTVGTLVPSGTGERVVTLLTERLGEFMEYNFTAAMEVDLDGIARGQQDRGKFLKSFFFGNTSHRGLVCALDTWKKSIRAPTRAWVGAGNKHCKDKQKT